jgi:hypothetical protein
MLPIVISYHLQASSLVIDGATSTAHRCGRISYLKDKYVASAIGDGQRGLQMIANKNGGHIEPYLVLFCFP